MARRSEQPRRKRRGGSRRQRIVEHVMQHRISTNSVIHKHICPDLTPNAVSKATTRLCAKGLLVQHPLFLTTNYFTLGSAGARLLGVPLYRARPLGPQALVIEYGVLAHAAMGSTYRQRLTSADLDELLPGVRPLLVHAAYCLDESSCPSVLELVRVDLGGGADHVARKAAFDFRLRRNEPAFQPWLSDHRLRLVIVTGSTDKSAAIRAAVNQHLWPDGLSIHLAVVTPLLRLTGRI